jgi:hypothetical protein
MTNSSLAKVIQSYTGMAASRIKAADDELAQLERDSRTKRGELFKLDGKKNQLGIYTDEIARIQETQDYGSKQRNHGILSDAGGSWADIHVKLLAALSKCEEAGLPSCNIQELFQLAANDIMQRAQAFHDQTVQLSLQDQKLSFLTITKTGPQKAASLLGGYISLMFKRQPEYRDGIFQAMRASLEPMVEKSSPDFHITLTRAMSYQGTQSEKLAALAAVLTPELAEKIVSATLPERRKPLSPAKAWLKSILPRALANQMT